MSATTSRREDLRDALVTEFGQISTANGFRTNPAQVSRLLLFPKDVHNFPTICVILDNPEEVRKVDDNRQVFNSEVPVVILGYFQGDLENSGVEIVPGDREGEELLHDMKRATADFILKYVNAATPWHVMGKKFRAYGPVLGRDMTRGECRIEFDVQLQAQDTDF